MPITTTDKEAFAALERMAREINPEIPTDLTDCVVTITLSKDGQYAQATSSKFRHLPGLQLVKGDLA